MYRGRGNCQLQPIGAEIRFDAHPARKGHLGDWDLLVANQLTCIHCRALPILRYAEDVFQRDVIGNEYLVVAYSGDPCTIVNV